MVKGLTGVPADIRLESFPDPGTRFTLGQVIGSGISGVVYEATDSQAGWLILLFYSRITSKGARQLAVLCFQQSSKKRQKSIFQYF